MGTEWWQGALSVIFFLGVCGPALGLAGLLRRSPEAASRRSWIGLVPVATLVGLAATAAALGAAPGVWRPPLLLAGVCAAFVAVRSPRLGRAAARSLNLLRNRRAQAFLLLLTGPAALGWVFCLEHLAADTFTPDDLAAVFGRPDLGAVEPSPGMTDAGRPVHLSRPVVLSSSPHAYEESELRLAKTQGLMLRAIRTAPADTDSNCFGWVFAGGRFWLPKGADVELILHDNGYGLVSVPRPGDLAVYRNSAGDIAHAGVVRGHGDDGLTLVESKWGCLGRFIHPADTHSYPDTTCSYYRTARPHGHLLRGLLPGATKPDAFGPSAVGDE